jgi:hypothetical protein
MITDWGHLKDDFHQYIRTTTGLFTLIHPEHLQYFNLDRFLERMTEKPDPLSLSQLEMIMSLATFLTNHEMNNTLSFRILPRRVRLQFKTLIERNVLQLCPFSKIKKACRIILYNSLPAAAA